MFLQTPIGVLSFSACVHDREIPADEVLFKHAQLKPHLPPGMSVDSLDAVLIELKPHFSLQAVMISCKWLSNPGPWHDRPTGECLDAQSWVSDNKLVLIGTEDFDSLAGRLKEHGLFGEPSPTNHCVNYCDDGFEIVLPQVPAHQITSLHFIVASNQYPEPVDCSAWYAVDVPHRLARAGAGEG